MDKGPEVRTLETRLLYTGRVFQVVSERIELPSGLRQDLALVRHPGAVGIVPLMDDGSVVLVKQYRHAVGRELLEIPAGRLEPGEAPELAARRELEEETGLRATTLEPLGSFFPAPGFCSEELHLFVARGLVAAGDSRAACDADEELSVVVLPFELARERSAQDAKSFIALARLAPALAPAGPSGKSLSPPDPARTNLN